MIPGLVFILDFQNHSGLVPTGPGRGGLAELLSTGMNMQNLYLHALRRSAWMNGSGLAKFLVI